MELLEKTKEPVHVIAIPTMEIGKFPIKNQTIRLTCAPYKTKDGSAYIYKFDCVRKEIKELIEGLGLDPINDIHIYSDKSRARIDTEYNVFIRIEDLHWYELNSLKEKEPRYQLITDILESNKWEFREHVNDGEENLFRRYFKIYFKKKYTIEPHLRFYVSPGTHKFKYHVVEISTEGALIELCIHKRYCYTSEPEFMLHWQVIGGSAEE